MTFEEWIDNLGLNGPALVTFKLCWDDSRRQVLQEKLPCPECIHKEAVNERLRAELAAAQQALAEALPHIPTLLTPDEIMIQAATRVEAQRKRMEALERVVELVADSPAEPWILTTVMYMKGEAKKALAAVKEGK